MGVVTLPGFISPPWREVDWPGMPQGLPAAHTWVCQCFRPQPQFESRLSLRSGVTARFKTSCLEGLGHYSDDLLILPQELTAQLLLLEDILA